VDWFCVRDSWRWGVCKHSCWWFHTACGDCLHWRGNAEASVRCCLFADLCNDASFGSSFVEQFWQILFGLAIWIRILLLYYFAGCCWKDLVICSEGSKRNLYSLCQWSYLKCHHTPTWFFWWHIDLRGMVS